VEREEFYVGNDRSGHADSVSFWAAHHRAGSGTHLQVRLHRIITPVETIPDEYKIPFMMWLTPVYLNITI
jgi:hypothetical protein